MQYKEFQSGEIDVPVAASVAAWSTGASITRYEETCSDHTIAAFDILNTGSAQLFLRALSGWDSLAEKLYSPIDGSIESFAALASATADANSNLAIRLKRTEGLTAVSNTYGNNAAIAANSRAIILTSVTDIQIMQIRLQRQSGTVPAQIAGIFKGGLEGISSLFEVATVSGTSAWIDCRAYAYAAFEVVNTGGTTLTNFSVEIRRHPLGTSNSVSLNASNLVESNPIRRLQRVRSLNPTTLSTGGIAQVDFDVKEAHSIRFVIAFTSAQCTIRGVLKG